ncbi:PREDICTED: prolyl endopeptidase-like isoform X1 [Corvus brachyrhynchos]|uniref:prolyl endopeptidase-like isoform X1 n=1 Tax=Corvus brachyrhynchos TaxID=85066 RepID=UPI000816331B|nr:PREDICTED: prolyl endopeptidase-like isoform X1 [Corvus brachyrhynchos]XP_017600343.1 PREDICTED: prolyl endopeptidase-like isoform X1 [Corvus brachyrhynchos]XP_017600344.1 PREDICTED: prolyl endopeptidase-like isoform X1 [Corvus brachyrhynchos]
MKVRMCCAGLRNLLQGLRFSAKYYSKHNLPQTMCPYSKSKPIKCCILDCSESTCTHRTAPPGSILPCRFFSCKEGTKVPSKRKQNTSRVTSDLLHKNLLKSEQENWNDISPTYKAVTKRIKGKLEELLNMYTRNSGSPRMRFGENVYFEENGCIFLAKADDVDEGNADILFSIEDLGFSDAFIQRIRISPDQSYMAISLKSENSEEATCIIMKLGNFPVVEKVIPSVFSFEWAANDVLYYTTQKNLKCQNVFMTTFTYQKHTKLVYTEQDARFFVDLYCTKDRRFLTINSNSKTTSEVWLVDCTHPFESPALVQARTPGVFYHIEHRKEQLYILTTYGEPAEYKLMKAPVACSGKDNWQLVYALEKKTKLVDFEMFSDDCIMFLKNAGHLYLNVISFVSHLVQSIQLPTWACEFELESHLEHTTSTCYFQLSSPVHPPKRFAYSFKENNLIEQAVQEVPIITNCHTTRLLAKSKDETLVPITVFHNKNSKELHRRPLLVHVYGAYGIDLNMSFKEEKLMLIEEGWILAYCHVRGGGEQGLSWHRDGCQRNKLKGLHDLRACIMLLHELGFSQPKHTALAAASAGGVLAGALCNTDPALIRAVVLQAPFVDVLNTMMKTHLPLTIEEQEEWGNPLEDEICMKYIKSYCPYQNIKPQCYPSVFITAYENDERTPLTGILQYVQKLRKAALDHASRKSKKVITSFIVPGNWIPNIILDVQANGSHCDSSWEHSLNEVARHLAFLSRELEEVCHPQHHSKPCK